MSKKLKFVIAGLVLVVAAVGAGLFLFFKDDAPEEANLADAVATAEDAAGTGDDAEATDDTEATDEAPAEGVEGTWAVDTTIGTFDFSDTASATYVGFRIDEELSSVGSTTAVGRTPAVTGEITLEGTTLAEATFEADLTQITTDRAQRNSRVQSALETSEFPTATFTLTEPIDFGAGADAGSPVTVTATGDLTIHGITQPVEMELQAQLTGDIIVVVGQLDIVFADYDVTVPSAPIVVSASDEGIVEVQLFFSRV